MLFCDTASRLEYTPVSHSQYLVDEQLTLDEDGGTVGTGGHLTVQLPHSLEVTDA